MEYPPQPLHTIPPFWCLMLITVDLYHITGWLKKHYSIAVFHVAESK